MQFVLSLDNDEKEMKAMDPKIDGRTVERILMSRFEFQSNYGTGLMKEIAGLKTV